MLVSDETPTLHDVVHLYGEELWDTERPYPIWNEEDRTEFQQKIIDHFEFRKIGQETPALFIAYLSRRMREMMPTLNPIFSALADEKLDITRSYITTDETESSNVADSTARQLFSNTPQAQLSGAKDYATNLTDTTGNQTGKNTGKSTHQGSQGNIASVLTEWYTGVNNALYLVFNGLEPLFMQIYDEEGF